MLDQRSELIKLTRGNYTEGNATEYLHLTSSIFTIYSSNIYCFSFLRQAFKSSVFYFLFYMIIDHFTSENSVLVKGSCNMCFKE